MIYVLKMDFMNLKNPKQFIPGKILQVFSLLDGCCLQLPHLGKTVQHLQIYLSFGVGVTYILNTIQEHFQSPMHVIHKFSFFREEFLIMSYQNGTLFEFDTFCAFVILNESQISLSIFRLQILLYSFLDNIHIKVYLDLVFSSIIAKPTSIHYASSLVIILVCQSHKWQWKILATLRSQWNLVVYQELDVVSMVKTNQCKFLCLIVLLLSLCLN